MSETKIVGKRVADLAARLAFVGCVPISSDGLSGSLALFWSYDVEVTLNNVSGQYTNANIKSVGGDGQTWRFFEVLCEGEDK